MIPVQRPPAPPPVENPGRKASSKWTNIGAATLGAVGGVAGGIGGFVAGGPAGAVAGAIGGAGGGASLGATLGGTMDKKGIEPSTSYSPNAPQGVPQANREDAVSRRMASNSQDKLQELGFGLQALGRSDPEIQKQYTPPVYQAYIAEYNSRTRGVG